MLKLLSRPLGTDSLGLFGRLFRVRVSSLRAPWETSLELALGIQGTEFGGGGGSLSGALGGMLGLWMRWLNGVSARMPNEIYAWLLQLLVWSIS